MICKNIKCKAELPDNAKYCIICGKNQTENQKKAKQRGNGQGTVVKKPTGKYQAIVTLCYYKGEDGKLKRKTKTKLFDKRSDALEFLPRLKNFKKIKTHTLLELNNRFIDSKKYFALSKSQKDKLSYAWKRLEPLYYKKIDELTIDEMQETIDEAVTTYYPARDMKNLLSHLYTIAIKLEDITVNKTKYIELPQLNASTKDAFTDAEIDVFWKDYEDGQEFTGNILIMIYAGLRYGEISSISKENIHLNKQYMIGGIKTEAGIDREIPIADKILPIVKKFYNKNSNKLLELSEKKFYEFYRDTVKRLDVRELTPHCCRHTYFTRLTNAGVQTGIITEVGGHKDYSTTLQYVHTPLKTKLDAVNKI